MPLCLLTLVSPPRRDAMRPQAANANSQPTTPSGSPPLLTSSPPPAPGPAPPDPYLDDGRQLGIQLGRLGGSTARASRGLASTAPRRRLAWGDCHARGGGQQGALQRGLCASWRLQEAGPCEGTVRARSLYRPGQGGGAGVGREVVGQEQLCSSSSSSSRVSGGTGISWQQGVGSPAMARPQCSGSTVTALRPNAAPWFHVPGPLYSKPYTTAPRRPCSPTRLRLRPPSRLAQRRAPLWQPHAPGAPTWGEGPGLPCGRHMLRGHPPGAKDRSSTSSGEVDMGEHSKLLATLPRGAVEGSARPAHAARVE